MMNENNFISFTASPRILAHLGEELIKSENIALIELVKNSYDADATECSVLFNISEKNLDQNNIVILDNGIGMTYEDIKNKWAVIGTDSKKDVKPSKLGRYPLGEKGIGRLGVHKLGNVIDIVTKTTLSSEVKLHIDWIDLDNAKNLDEQKINVVEQKKTCYFTNGSHGTKIVISGLKTLWNRDKIRKAYSELLSLNSPYETTNDSFRVKVDCSISSYIEDLPSIKDIIKESGMYFGSCVLSGNSISAFEYKFIPWPTILQVSGRTVLLENLKDTDKNIYRLVSDGFYRSKKTKKIIDLNQYKIGSVKFNLVIFETDNAVFKLLSNDKKIVKDYLEQNGGIRVYRDGMRVYNYGEKDNDWLGIDISRVHRLGAGISNNIIIGGVFLNRKDSVDLKEKTNREGFIEDDAYEIFKSAVKHALEIFIRERNIDKARLSKQYKKSKDSSVNNFIKEVNDAMDLAKDLIIEPTHQKKMLQLLQTIQDDYIKVRDVLIRSANIGLNLSAVIHEIEKVTALLINSLKNKDIDNSLELGNRLDQIVSSFVKFSKRKKVEIFSLDNLIQNVVRSLKYRFKDHIINIISPQSHKEIFGSYGVISSLLINLLDNAIFWTVLQRDTNRKIAIFYTDSISGYDSIVVADNGSGFNIPYDIAVEPFTTGKPEGLGMGLGLHIANQYMISIKGALKFPEIRELNVPSEINTIDFTGACVALCFSKNEEGLNHVSN